MKKVFILSLFVFALTMGGYFISPFLLLGASALMLLFSIFSNRPTDSIIPFAVITTWGAPIWDNAFPRLYTIVKLSLIAIFIIRLIFYKEKQLTKNACVFIIALILFLLYSLLSEWMRESIKPDFLELVNLGICYVVIYYWSATAEAEDYEKFAVAVGMGVILSAIITALSPLSPTLFGVVQEMLTTDNAFQFEDIDGRFSALTYDPNQLGMYALVSMSLIFVLIHRHHYKKTIPEIVLIASLFVIGLLSLSKTYFLISAIFAILAWRCFNRTKGLGSRTKFKAVLLVVLLVILASSFLSVYVDAVVSRFTGSDASDVTTGRSSLWLYYSDYLFNHFDVLLFGNSLTGKVPNMSTPHNFILFMLFYFGVIGVTLFGILIIQMKRGIITSSKTYRTKDISRYIPLIIFVLFTMTIDIFEFYDDKMIFLCGCFSAAYGKNEYPI